MSSIYVGRYEDGVLTALLPRSIWASGLFPSLGLGWSGVQWAFLGAAVLSGLVIETCIVWIIGWLVFWTGRARSIFFVVWRLSVLTQQHPMDAFRNWSHVFVTGRNPLHSRTTIHPPSWSASAIRWSSPGWPFYRPLWLASSLRWDSCSCARDWRGTPVRAVDVRERKGKATMPII